MVPRACTSDMFGASGIHQREVAVPRDRMIYWTMSGVDGYVRHGIGHANLIRGLPSGPFSGISGISCACTPDSCLGQDGIIRIVVTYGNPSKLYVACNDVYTGGGY